MVFFKNTMKEVFLSKNVEKKIKEYRSKLRILNIAIPSGIALLIVFGVFKMITGVTITFVLILITLMVKRHYNFKIHIYLPGLEGEKILQNTLRKSLSNEYTAFYGVPVKNSGDIDCLIIGPKGIFLIEVKHHRGKISYTNKGWIQIKKGRKGGIYRGSLKQPGTQLLINMHKLKEFLNASGINVWIQPVLVYTNPESVINLEKDPSPVKVCKIEQLKDVINSSNESLSPQEIKKIYTLLMKEKLVNPGRIFRKKAQNSHYH